MAFSFAELLKKQFPLAELGASTGGSKRMPETSPFPTSALGALPMGGLIEALSGVTGIPEGAGFKMADLFDNDRWEQVSGSEFGIPENPRRGEVRMTNRYIPREYGADASIIEDQRIAASPTMPYSPPTLEGRNPPVPAFIPPSRGYRRGNSRFTVNPSPYVPIDLGPTGPASATPRGMGYDAIDGQYTQEQLDSRNSDYGPAVFPRGIRPIESNPWDAYNQQRSDVGRITAGNKPSNDGIIFDRLAEVNGGLGNADIKEVIKESEGSTPNTRTTTISYGSNAMEGRNPPVPAAYMSKGNPVRSAPYQGNPGARLGPNWRGPVRYSPQRGFDVNRGFQGANFGALTPYLGRIGTGAAGLLFNSEALGGGMDMYTPESAVDEMMQEQGMQKYNEAQENFEPYAPLDVIIDPIKEFYRKKLKDIDPYMYDDFGGA